MASIVMLRNIANEVKCVDAKVNVKEKKISMNRYVFSLAYLNSNISAIQDSHLRHKMKQITL